jgi:ribosomal protein S18 acetylase RimI-like enzyme
MNRTITPFSQELESPLLAIFRSQYTGEIEPNESLMKEKIYKDPNYRPELTLCVLEGQKLRAFAMGVLREVRGEKIGYIKLLLVDRKASHQGSADLLIDELERRLTEMGAEKLRIFDSPLNYFLPGINAFDTAFICLAEKKGYKKFGDTVNMTVDLSDTSKFNTDDAVEQLVQKGITIKRLETMRELESLMTFVDKDFALWRHELTLSAALSPKAIHIAIKDAKVIAFSAYEGNNKGTGWFGPMGTSNECRGLGIGGILLKRCLLDLAERGFEKGIIPWVGPIGFYAKQVGAKISSIYWRYEKVISNA